MEVVGKFFLLLFTISSLFSCSPRALIKKELIQGEHDFRDHKGFLIFDPQSEKYLVDFNAHRYFTPASNTKIFTFYTGLQVLGDSIPALHYVDRNDSLIFWGTGDPSFLYRAVYQDSTVFNFLKDAGSQLFFSTSNFHDERFGPGWAWDDYNYSFSPERSAFPIYGNLIAFTDSLNDVLSVMPRLFLDSVATSKNFANRKKLTRSLSSNQFTFDSKDSNESLSREIPIKLSDQLIAQLISDTLKRKVRFVNLPIPKTKGTLYSIPSDSLYKVMMQDSDNFIAEQLLLVSAGVLSDTLDTQIAIDYVKGALLNDLSDEPQWVDGSGLSRYNLFTPYAIVELWNKILKEVPQQRLFNILATGGEAGTIKNLYKNEYPFVYGKTGTLSNNHCLSGYLVTKSNKVLIFSFMNNNYTTTASEVKLLMDRILRIAHEKY